ncbi:MAG: ankyrin repeat domain-containing protein [Brevinema sp.]
MKKIILVLLSFVITDIFAQEEDLYDGYDSASPIEIVEGDEEFTDETSDKDEIIEREEDAPVIEAAIPESTTNTQPLSNNTEETEEITVQTIIETVTNTVVLTNTIEVTNTNIVSLPNVVPISLTACLAVLNENINDLEAFYRINNSIITNRRKDGNSLLHLAATRKNTDIIEFLVAQGTDINITNQLGQTPLHLATTLNNIVAIKTILALNANPWIKDSNGNTALGIANLKQLRFAIKLIATSATNIPSTEKTMVMKTLQKDPYSTPSNFDLYKTFAQKIADKGPILNTAWHKALYSRGYLATEQLIKMGISPYLKDKFGQNAFHLAGLYDNIEALKYLLLSFPLKEANKRDHFGATPLHIAAGKSSPALVLELINYGCDISTKNKAGWTPLFESIFLGNQDNVMFFLKNGISPNQRTPKGRTPLHEAAVQGNSIVVKALLEAGALFNVSDYQGKTPFYLAAEHGYIEVLSLLLDKGANPNIINKDEMNALHIAVVNNQKDTVHFLVNIANINIYQPDQAGRTPLDIAYMNGYTEIINILAIKYTAE